MLTFAVLSGPLPRIGVIIAALCAAAAVIDPDARRRAVAMLSTMVLGAVLLLDDVWDSSHLAFVRQNPADGVVLALAGLIVLAFAAILIRRVPWAVAPLAVLTLPFRIPISAGGSTSNLLVPLYFVISAAAVGWALPVLIPALGRIEWPLIGRAPEDHGARSPSGERRPALLVEKLLCAFVVLYAVQLTYSPGTQVPSGFQKGLQNEVFFYLPFAVLLSMLRDLPWTARLMRRCLLVTVGLALVLSLVGFGELASGHVLFDSKLAQSNQLHVHFAVNSVFFDPDIFGRYLALTMILVVAVLLYDKRRRVQLGACAVLVVLWGCLLFTLSRSSIVALLLGMVVLAGFRWKAKPILYAAGVVVVVGIVAAVTHPSAFGFNVGSNFASGGRANLVAGGLHMFGQKPLLGWGSGSFEHVYTHEFPISARSVADSHNIPVTILSEQGLLGFVFYLALVIAAIATLLRGAKPQPARVAIAAAFIALLLHTQLYADFLEDPTTWVLLAIGGALSFGGNLPAGSTPIASAASAPPDQAAGVPSVGV